MLEAARIAAEMMEGDDPVEASVLVSLADDPLFVITPRIVWALDYLGSAKLLAKGRPTPLGWQVVMVLRARYCFLAPGKS